MRNAQHEHELLQLIKTSLLFDLPQHMDHFCLPLLVLLDQTDNVHKVKPHGHKRLIRPPALELSAFLHEVQKLCSRSNCLCAFFKEKVEHALQPDGELILLQNFARGFVPEVNGPFK